MIRVTLNDYPFGFDKGYADFEHTATWFPDVPFDIIGSDSWNPTTTGIGFSVTGEDSPCQPTYFSGSHLHEMQGPQYWWQQASNTGNTCSGYYPDYSCRFSPYYSHTEWLDLGRWQFRQSWTWTCC